MKCQTAPCRALRGNSISVNCILPPSYAYIGSKFTALSARARDKQALAEVGPHFPLWPRAKATPSSRNALVDFDLGPRQPSHAFFPTRPVGAGMVLFIPPRTQQGHACRVRPTSLRGHASSDAALRGWRNTVGHLIEIVWLKNAYRGPQFTGKRVKHGGERFYRFRDFQQSELNSIPPTSHVRNAVDIAATAARRLACFSGVDRDQSEHEGSFRVYRYIQQQSGAVFS